MGPDLVPAVAAGVIVWLLFMPVSVSLEKARTATDALDEYGTLLRLGIQVQTADSVARAYQRVAGTELSECSFPSASRLQTIADLQARMGIAVAPLIALVTSEVRHRQQLEQRWQEQSASAHTTSGLLVGLPVVMLLLAQGLQIPAAAWLFSGGWANLCLVGFGVLTLLARRSLRVTRRIALREPRIASGRTMTANTAAVIATVTILVLLGGVVGIVFSAAVFVAVRETWHLTHKARLDDSQQIELMTLPWPTAVLASALRAGSDWVSAVRLASEVASARQQATFAEVVRLLGWGVAPAKAFERLPGLYRELGSVIQQAGVSGVPVATGLFELAQHWQDQLATLRTQRVEKMAARAVVPVSLLQLPAFILAGLVPMVAAQLLPILSEFAGSGGLIHM